MYALRILYLPISMAAFAVLYVTATKIPATVEEVNLLLWLLLPVIFVVRIARNFSSRRKN